MIIQVKLIYVAIGAVIGTLAVFLIGFWFGYRNKQRFYEFIINELEKSNIKAYDHANEFIENLSKIDYEYHKARIALAKKGRVCVRCEKRRAAP